MIMIIITIIRFIIINLIPSLSTYRRIKIFWEIILVVYQFLFCILYFCYYYLFSYNNYYLLLLLTINDIIINKYNQQWTFLPSVRSRPEYYEKQQTFIVLNLHSDQSNENILMAQCRIRSSKSECTIRRPAFRALFSTSIDLVIHAVEK